MARGMLTEKFPEYNFNLVEVDTGTLAAKMVAEGKDTDCDIILELESTYMKKISDNLAELKDVDFSKYIDDIVPESHKYVPFTRLSGAIILNKKTFEEKNLPIPESYDDLLKPEYKGLISMPNPKSSGTGYIFYLNMYFFSFYKMSVIVEILLQKVVKDVIFKIIDNTEMIG